MMARSLRVVMLMVVVVVAGCEPGSTNPTPKKVTSEDVRRDAGKAAETATEYSREAMEEFQKNLEGKLKNLDAEIARLREKGHGLKDQAKVNWDAKMADLETKRDAVRIKLAEIGRSSAGAWKDVKQGAQSAWDDLNTAFHKIASEF